MRAYIAHSYAHRKSQADILLAIKNVLVSQKVETIIFSEKYDNFEAADARNMMQLAFDEIRQCDFLIAEVSSKEIGIGVEVGYAAALSLPIIYVYKEGSEYSTTVAGCSVTEVTYSSLSVLRVKLSDGLAGMISRHQAE